jgi:hypothetical protein
MRLEPFHIICAQKIYKKKFKNMCDPFRKDNTMANMTFEGRERRPEASRLAVSLLESKVNKDAISILHAFAEEASCDLCLGYGPPEQLLYAEDVKYTRVSCSDSGGGIFQELGMSLGKKLCVCCFAQDICRQIIPPNPIGLSFMVDFKIEALFHAMLGLEFFHCFISDTLYRCSCTYTEEMNGATIRVCLQYHY